MKFDIVWVTEDTDKNLTDSEISKILKDEGYIRRGNVIENKSGEIVGRIIHQKESANA